MVSPSWLSRFHKFQHDRLEVVKRVENGGEVKTSDVARLMEILQASLLKYWEQVDNSFSTQRFVD